MKDLFKLDIFEESMDDDTVIYDESVDSGAKPSVSESSVTIPGGNGEKPSAKPYDAAAVTVPNKTTITEDQYNNALVNLKKSFKEAAEVVEALENAEVVKESVEERQAFYTESALEEALLSSYEDGPMFESVDREDKNKIKSIVKKLRTKLPGFLKEEADCDFRTTSAISRFIVNSSKSDLTAAWWVTRFWQVIGVIYQDPETMQKTLEMINDEYADELGAYKVLSVPVLPNMFDAFSVRWGWKNRQDVVMLIVDKKMPAEIKKMQREVEDALKKSGSTKDDDSNDKKLKK